MTAPRALIEEHGHAVLDRNGLVKLRKRRRYKAKGTALKHVKQPNPKLLGFC